MEDYRQGSIHDIDAAPDAPDASALMSDVGSGNKALTTPRALRSSSLKILSPSFLRSNHSSQQLNDIGAPVTPQEKHGSQQDKTNQISGDSGAILSLNPVRRKTSEDSFSEFLEDDNIVDNGNDGDEDEDASTLQSLDFERKPRVMWFCGCVPFPLFWNFRPKWTRYAATLVRNAPCFWFCFNRLDVGATDRNVVYRLNLLCAFFASVEIGFFCYHMYMLGWPDADRDVEYRLQQKDVHFFVLNLWGIPSSAVFAGVLACIILIVEIATLPLIREVNLSKAMAYYWALGWFLPLQAIFAFGLFDFFGSSRVWIKHWWNTPLMALYRQQFCDDGTYKTECVVPINGGVNFLSEDSWCIRYFNKTDCIEIRERAQESVKTFADFYFSVFGVICLLLMLLLWLTRFVLSGIISKPIIERHRESNITAWLAFPIILSFGVATITFFSPVFHPDNLDDLNDLGIRFAAIWYLVCGSAFLISALLALFAGTYNIRTASDKRIKTIAATFFMVLGVMNVLFIAFILSESIILALSLRKSDVNDEIRGDLACLADDSRSCSCCDCERKCPEWTSADVSISLQLQNKFSIVLAVILLVYAISTLRYGVEMKRHISMYQIDYV